MLTKSKQKLVKKVATKKLIKKKNTDIFYALIHKEDMKDCIDSNDNISMYLENAKSSHMNHCINSFLLNNSESTLKDMRMVKVEVMGVPNVKTTREITIKK